MVKSKKKMDKELFGGFTYENILQSDLLRNLANGLQLKSN